MPKRTAIDEMRLARLVKEQYGVITRDQALACDHTGRTIGHLTAPGGAWQRLLPGVYLTVTGKPARDQLEMAALLYAGAGGMITGTAALRRHGIVAPGPDIVDVLIPWTRRRQSIGFVRVHRTRRMPSRFWTVRAIRYAKPERAVADAARLLTRFNDVRDVVAEAIQLGKCTIAELITELEAGPQAQVACFQQALAEVSDGTRSVAEGDFRSLIMSSHLPEPIYNAKLYDARGRFIAMVDAWWPQAGVAAEVDSRRYHLKAKDQDATNARHNRLTARYGIHIVHYPPTLIRTRGPAIIAELDEAIRTGLTRPPLPITAVPIAA
jgi:hypothetical protein